MKYKDIKVEDARRCCKHHKKNCEICPLSREKRDKNGNLHKLFCWYILRNFYDDVEEEKTKLEQEEIYYEKEWEEYINKIETQEK